jgi:hypothetical protein
MTSEADTNNIVISDISFQAFFRFRQSFSCDDQAIKKYVDFSQMQEICKEDPTLVGTTIHKTTSYIWIKNSNDANYNLVSFLIKH